MRRRWWWRRRRRRRKKSQGEESNFRPALRVTLRHLSVHSSPGTCWDLYYYENPPIMCIASSSIYSRPCRVRARSTLVHAASEHESVFRILERAGKSIRGVCSVATGSHCSHARISSRIHRDLHQNLSSPTSPTALVTSAKTDA